jgi:hypothetical protein
MKRMTASNDNDGYFEAYWPRGPRQVSAKQLAPRFKSLDGKRVAFLWDFLFQGNVIFETIERELSRRYTGMSFVGWREIGNIHGKDEREMVAALPARLKTAGVDAVITAGAA